LDAEVGEVVESVAAGIDVVLLDLTVVEDEEVLDLEELEEEVVLDSIELEEVDPSEVVVVEDEELVSRAERSWYSAR